MVDSKAEKKFVETEAKQLKSYASDLKEGHNNGFCYKRNDTCPNLSASLEKIDAAEEFAKNGNYDEAHSHLEQAHTGLHTSSECLQFSVRHTESTQQTYSDKPLGPEDLFKQAFESEMGDCRIFINNIKITSVDNNPMPTSHKGMSDIVNYMDNEDLYRSPETHKKAKDSLSRSSKYLLELGKRGYKLTDLEEPAGKILVSQINLKFGDHEAAVRNLVEAEKIFKELFDKEME